MKLLWVSPQGHGSSTAEAVHNAGHTVVVYGAESIPLPHVTKSSLYTLASTADLIVVDGAFPLVRTKSSWKPSQDALFIEELRRHYDAIALGPTPTVDLLVGDPRYLRKWCRRLAVPVAQDWDSSGELWESGGWFHRNEVVPDGPYLAAWKPLFKSVGFRGWFLLEGYIGQDGVCVTGASAAWPVDALPEGHEVDFLVALTR